MIITVVVIITLAVSLIINCCSPSPIGGRRQTARLGLAEAPTKRLFHCTMTFFFSWNWIQIQIFHFIKMMAKRALCVFPVDLIPVEVWTCSVVESPSHHLSQIVSSRGV